jgi:hypothetical protein
LLVCYQIPAGYNGRERERERNKKRHAFVFFGFGKACTKTKSGEEAKKSDSLQENCLHDEEKLCFLSSYKLKLGVPVSTSKNTYKWAQTSKRPMHNHQ